MQTKNTVEFAVHSDEHSPTEIANRLAGQLRHASKLAAIGDDMTDVYRRLGHAFRHLSDNLHQLAGDTLTGPGGNWAPTPRHLGHVRVGDWVMHATRGPVRVELIEADGDELVFVYGGDRRVAASDCLNVLDTDAWQVAVVRERFDWDTFDMPVAEIPGWLIRYIPDEQYSKLRQAFGKHDPHTSGITAPVNFRADGSVSFSVEVHPCNRTLARIPPSADSPDDAGLCEVSPPDDLPAPARPAPDDDRQIARIIGQDGRLVPVTAKGLVDAVANIHDIAAGLCRHRAECPCPACSTASAAEVDA